VVKFYVLCCFFTPHLCKSLTQAILLVIKGIMLSFINTAELYHIYHTYSSIHKLDLVDLVSKRGIDIIKLDSWSQLLEISQTDNLFTQQPTILSIYDVQNLSLDAKILSGVSSDSDIYLFNSQNKLLAGDKKIIIQSGAQVIEPDKINTDFVERFITKYASNIEFNLPHKYIKDIVTISDNLFEIVDIIDYLYLADDAQTALSSLKKITEIPLFMLSIRENKLGEDIKRWLPYLHADESQLIISLLFTKLDKGTSKLSKQLQKDLIAIDNKIKSQSKLDSVLLLKLFIWKTHNQNTYAL
jgi:hypothetical protein